MIQIRAAVLRQIQAELITNKAIQAHLKAKIQQAEQKKILHRKNKTAKMRLFQSLIFCY